MPRNSNDFITLVNLLCRPLLKISWQSATLSCMMLKNVDGETSCFCKNVNVLAAWLYFRNVVFLAGKWRHLCMDKIYWPQGHKTRFKSCWYPLFLWRHKSQGLLRFYLQLIKDPLKINFYASFQRESFFRFENIALSNFPIGDREAVRYAKKIILLLDIMLFEWWKY